jgi:hypothetical protein
MHYEAEAGRRSRGREKRPPRRAAAELAFQERGTGARSAKRPPECAAGPRGAAPWTAGDRNLSDHCREQKSGEDQERHDRKAGRVAERVARRGGEDCMSTPNHSHGRALLVDVVFTFLSTAPGVKNKIGTTRLFAG